MLKNKISFALVKKVVLDRSGNGMESFGKDRSCEIKNNLLPASPTPTPTSTPTSTSEMDIFDRLKRKQKHLRYLHTYSLTCLLQSVWPDLAKFRHFGKIVKVFGYSVRVLPYIRKHFELGILLWHCFWLPNIEKNNLGIGSHWPDG